MRLLGKLLHKNPLSKIPCRCSRIGQLPVQLRLFQQPQQRDSDSSSSSFFFFFIKKATKGNTVFFHPCPFPGVFLDCPKLWHEPCPSFNCMSSVNELPVSQKHKPTPLSTGHSIVLPPPSLSPSTHLGFISSYLPVLMEGKEWLV